MSSANSSLRPAWRNASGGRGFQPPPTVNSERGRSASIGSEGSDKSQGRVYNKFSALDDEDDWDVVGSHQPKSRLEGLRQGLAVRSASTGTKPGGSGRSLADLAATVPDKQSSTSSRFARDENVIRFTRERLLSMRPQPKKEMPECLSHLEGTVVLAESAQDPVCFDPFDADAIWATVPARRSSSAKLTRESSQGEADTRRSSTRGSSSGRWQRGVALPPPSATTPTARGNKEIITDNPEDLWDDPTTAAAADFSAFGDMGGADGDDGGDAFDFEKMAEESRRLESELHPENENKPNEGPAAGTPRPLAVVGTTIQSGSGDDVNVFEDFDDPANEPPTPSAEEKIPEPSQETTVVKGATEDPTASSRLMAMIGVNPDRSNDAEGINLAALVSGSTAPENMASVPKAPVSEPAPAIAGGWGSAEPESSAVNGLNIPLNPWGGSSLLGGPVVPTPTIPTQQPPDLGLQARLREAEMEQKAREQLRRQQELEAQKRAQQQQQQQDAQRQQGVQSQVELVLMERISTILENSWGRSDLMSILSTLHAEDSRVIPLLNNVDALRALLIRNSNRVQVQHDPSFGTEMAVLVMTNSQWQQQQQAAQAQQQEMRRRMQQQEEQQKQQQAQRQREESVALSRGGLRPNAPWFYSDPQGNIQGPFRPEEMRQWLVAGYFKGDLPVSQDPNGPFMALSSVFPDLNNAFVFNGDQPQQQAPPRQDNRLAEEEAQRRHLAEQQEREARERAATEARAKAEAAEQERRKKEAEEQEARQRRAAAEEAQRKAQAERKAQEEAAAAASASQNAGSNGGNESSAQLKMMLGLSSSGGGAGASANAGLQVPATPTPTPVAPRKIVEPKVEQPKRKPAKASEPAAPSAPEADSSPKPPAPAASPWGSAAQPARRKTMSEIQKEEARAAAIAAMQRESSRPSGSGWANVAASKGGTSGWSGGAVRAAPAAVLTRPQIAQPSPAATTSPHVRGKNVVDVAAINMQTAPQQTQAKGSKSSSADAFGAKMSPALEKWCREQMVKLNGTDDLTLVGFCMTLNDPNEIRQYLITYLGSSPQVNSFATEFINRKVGVKPAKEEWETTVTSKKKGKKKGK